MTAAEFQRYAIASAQTYSHYLEENGKGVATIAVERIQRDDRYFDLYLQTKLSPSVDLETLLFDFCGKRHTAFQIRPLFFDRIRIMLRVRPLDELTDNFAALLPSKLQVVSDLKFLVKRVEDWYQNFGASIHPCAAAPSIRPAFVSQAQHLSDEQKSAVSGALTQSLSYIWGAPGTGKTSHVLANCVLSYLAQKQDSRVLLLAPTNQAVEQMLAGILPALKEQKIPLDFVLRLGIPSSEFAASYPEVCETVDRDAKLHDLRKKENLLKKCLAFRQFSAQHSAAVAVCSSIAPQLTSLSVQAAQADAAILDMRRSTAVQRGKLLLLQDSINKSIASISERKKRLETSVLFRIKHVFAPRACQKELALLEAEHTQLQQQLSQAALLERDLAELQRSCEKQESVRSTALLEQATLRQHILSAVGFWPRLHHAVATLDVSHTEDYLSTLETMLADYAAQLSNRGTPYQCFAGEPDASVSTGLVACQQAISALAETVSRLEKACVVAATLDRFLSTATPDRFGAFQPEHIFVDEAGYAALIKTAPIFSLGVPVTLIGDHMQLPPVCEMNDAQFRTKGVAPVFLWAQSALYVEDILRCNPAQLLEAYLSATPPVFQAMKKYSLTATYRFGNALAEILVDMVYSPSFHSAIGNGTALFCLDAPQSSLSKSQTQKRSNQVEVDTIAAFLAQVPLTDYAILSPYRHQVSLLSATFPALRKEGRILTVHASQGKEWDILFFSAVDTYNKWFTDTMRAETKGKMIVNTAVSRTRKALILVCDTAYWSAQPDQLLGRMVRNAQPLCQPFQFHLP